MAWFCWDWNTLGTTCTTKRRSQFGTDLPLLGTTTMRRKMRRKRRGRRKKRRMTNNRVVANSTRLYSSKYTMFVEMRRNEGKMRSRSGTSTDRKIWRNGYLYLSRRNTRSPCVVVMWPLEEAGRSKILLRYGASQAERL